MKRILLVLVSLALIFSAGSAVVSAQPRGDRDGDGLPDSADNCPDQPGPRENGGCPLPETGGIPDRDGDGVADFVDLCPDQAGTGFTEGCPENQPEPTSNAPLPPPVTITQPLLPETGECLLATRGVRRINVRAEASTASPIVGTLSPAQTYPVIAIFLNPEGNWYRTLQGWVAEWVARIGGACDLLPTVQLFDLTTVNPGPPDTPPGVAPLEFEVVGADPDADPLAGFCADSLQIVGTQASAAASKRPPMVIFTWGSKFPAVAGGEWCVQDMELAPESSPDWEHNYEIRIGKYALTDYNFGGENTAFQGWPCRWNGYVLDGKGTDSEAISELVIQAIFLSPTDGEAPPDPDAPAVIIEWHMPFDPSAQGTHVLYQDIFIPPSPDTEGLIINWSILTESNPGPPDSPEANPGPPDSPVEVHPGPPTIQGMFIKQTGNESEGLGYIIGALWNDQAGGGVNEIVLNDTAGGEIIQVKWFIDQSLIVKP